MLSLFTISPYYAIKSEVVAEKLAKMTMDIVCGIFI